MKMQMLSQAQIKRIDTAGREILERVGVKILSAPIRKRLAQSGAEVEKRTQRVRLPAAWLEAWLSRAPSRVTLHARNGSPDLVLGSGRVYFGNGGRVFQILDLVSGEMRPTVLQDIADAACLVDQLAHIDFFIIPCQAADVAPGDYHLNDFFNALNNTDKHVMGGCDGLAGLRQMWSVAGLVAGGPKRLRRRPFVSVITNPISPLTVDGETLKMLEFCTTRGIPVTCAPAPIAGATAPATLAGTLVQMHAEALAGVALAQFFSPGAPVMYGAVPSTIDLRTMDLAIGSVETAMLNTAAVALAKRHRLPIYASAGLTDAKQPDVQAGFEKGVANLMVGLAGADFIHLAAGMLDSGNAIALAQYVIDNEILGMVRRILKGIDVNRDTLAMDCIAAVGPGGNYVLEDHTLSHMTDQFFYPRLSVRMQYDTWKNRQSPTPLSRARQVVEACLADRRERIDKPTLARIRKRFSQIRML